MAGQLLAPQAKAYFVLTEGRALRLIGTRGTPEIALPAMSWAVPITPPGEAPAMLEPKDLSCEDWEGLQALFTGVGITRQLLRWNSDSPGFRAPRMVARLTTLLSRLRVVNRSLA